MTQVLQILLIMHLTVSIIQIKEFKDTCANYAVQRADDSANQFGVTEFISSRNLCALDYTNKKCNDKVSSVKSFYTDFDCQSYLKSCKTNRQVCGSTSTKCNGINGSSDFCNALLDSTGKDKFKPIATSTTIFSMYNQKCYDNVTSTSDSECVED